jgi:hypothetical protein
MQAADFWDQAFTYDAYVAQMRENRELFERRLPATEVTDAERSALGAAPLRILILTEDYCGDSAQFIPAVGKLARELDNLDVRLLLRNEHSELAARYVRKDGYQAIPVFIIVDADGHELGYLIERPQRVYDELAAETRRFAQAHPELVGANRAYANMPPETKAAVFANSNSFRDTQQARWTRFLFDELAELVQQGRRREAQAAD